MIHYHGLPITGQTVAVRVINAGHPFVSFRTPGQLGMVLELCQSFAVDNGAFSAWTCGEPITDWEPYYQWVSELHRYPQFDFAVVPDVIDGDEVANDALLAAWPWRERARHVGAPVWHMHESLSRLSSLVDFWPRVCIGSSREYSKVGSPLWWARMSAAMDIVCDRAGRPAAKLHGLRMLDRRIFTKLPLSSADSTNIARNVGIDKNWRGTYLPMTKEARADVMRERIESYQSPTFWDRTEAAARIDGFIRTLRDDELEKFCMTMGAA